MEPASRETDPVLTAARPVLSVARRRIVRTFPWHAGIFLAGNLLLNSINALRGGSWWAFWPLVGSGLVLAVHYFLCKTVAVDEDWVEARTEELNLKSYDRSHIEDLKSRYGEHASGERQPER